MIYLVLVLLVVWCLDYFFLEKALWRLAGRCWVKWTAEIKQWANTVDKK